MAEEPLLLALRDGSLDEVRLAAAVALGQVGTAASVLPLKAAAEREGGLRKAAREAVAQIQSRLGGASPGQLSLAGGDGGALSLAEEDPRGQVSVTNPPTAVR
jgi:HEAT repeat protein